MDNIGPYKIMINLKRKIELPYMLKVLKENNAESFYNDQDEQLSPEVNGFNLVLYSANVKKFPYIIKRK